MLGAVLRCLEQFFPGVNTFWILLPGARWFWRKVPTQHNKKGAWKPYGYFIWTHLMLIQALLLALAKKHQAADYQQKVQILALYLSLSTWIPTKKIPTEPKQKKWFKKSKWHNSTLTFSIPGLGLGTFSNWPWPRVGETPGVSLWPPTSRYRGRGQGGPNLGSKLVHRDRAHPGGSGRWNHPPIGNHLEKPMDFYGEVFGYHDNMKKPSI